MLVVLVGMEVHAVVAMKVYIIGDLEEVLVVVVASVIKHSLHALRINTVAQVVEVDAPVNQFQLLIKMEVVEVVGELMEEMDMHLEDVTAVLMLGELEVRPFAKMVKT